MPCSTRPKSRQKNPAEKISFPPALESESERQTVSPAQPEREAQALDGLGFSRAVLRLEVDSEPYVPRPLQLARIPHETRHLSSLAMDIETLAGAFPDDNGPGSGRLLEGIIVHSGSIQKQRVIRSGAAGTDTDSIDLRDRDGLDDVGQERTGRHARVHALRANSRRRRVLNTDSTI